MTENSSQTIKDPKGDISAESSSPNKHTDEDKIVESPYEEKDIPSADSSSSRKNTDLENAGFTQEEFASLLGKYDYNF